MPECFLLVFMIMMVLSVTVFSSFLVIELELCESLVATSSSQESEFVERRGMCQDTP